MGTWLSTPPHNMLAFQYIGSKYNLAPLITEHIKATPHKTYVEVFGGTACVLLSKPRSEVEVYNDKDKRMACLFRFLATPELFKQLWRRFALSVHCREYRHRAWRALRAPKTPLNLAWAAAVCLAQGYGGRPFQGWSYSNCTKTVRQVIKAIYNLPRIHDRLKGVVVRELDFMDAIDEYDREGTLFYCDPPYVLSTVEGPPYDVMMTDGEHRKLIDRLLDIRGKAIISGYEHEIYAPLVQNGWRRLDIAVRSTVARKPKRRDSRTEVIWLSPGIVEPSFGPLFK